MFPSFQGEGVLVGIPQVFLRLSGCNLSCSYCDTPEARERADACMVMDRGAGTSRLPNPVAAEEAVSVVASLWEEAMHSVSITGGEPLLQAGGLAGLLPLLGERGIPVYLETNGTLPAALEGLLPWLDWIAMDVKLPSTQGGEDMLAEHRLFLDVARSKRAFLKCVVDAETGGGELARACRVLGEGNEDVTLVLQPATPRPGGERVSLRRACELCRLAAGYFRDVRLVPQVHHLWGIR